MTDSQNKGAANPAAPSKGAGAKAPAAVGAKKPTAKEVAANVGVQELWENDRGEFFTNENLALNSVGFNAKKLTRHDFTPAAEANAEGEA